MGAVRVVPNVFKNGTLFEKLLVSRRYDIIFFLSDGSVPLSFARHNILHFQVPFPVVRTNAFKHFDAVVCNSAFTKEHLDPVMSRKAVVIYPPSSAALNSSAKKKKIILSVGRFTPVHTAKKQDVLIDAFAAIHKALPQWELVLSGGLLPGDESYFAALTAKAKSLPVRLIPNADFTTISTLYRDASIYWHAAGYGETDPRYAEHFGISTVEAMGAGAVPVVYSGGGQPEIVEDGKNGYLWHTPQELITRTKHVIADKKHEAAWKHAVTSRAKHFSAAEFTKQFDALIRRW
jgi:glycosyltransferase involved in cell wall biosynthesis